MSDFSSLEREQKKDERGKEKQLIGSISIKELNFLTPFDI